MVQGNPAQQAAWVNVGFMVNGYSSEPGYLDMVESAQNLFQSVNTPGAKIDIGALSNMVTALSYFVGQYAAACAGTIPSPNQTSFAQVAQALGLFSYAYATSSSWQSNPPTKEMITTIATAISTYNSGVVTLISFGPPPGAAPSPPEAERKAG